MVQGRALFLVKYKTTRGTEGEFSFGIIVSLIGRDCHMKMQFMHSIKENLMFIKSIVTIGTVLVSNMGYATQEELRGSLTKMVNCDSIKTVVPANFSFVREMEGGRVKLIYEDKSSGIKLIGACSARLPTDDLRKEVSFFDLKSVKKVSDFTGVSILETRGDTSVLSYLVHQDVRKFVFSFVFSSAKANLLSESENARLAIFSSLAKENSCPNIKIPKNYWLADLSSKSRRYFNESSDAEFTLNCFKNKVNNKKQFIAAEEKRLRTVMSSNTKIAVNSDLDEIRTSLEDQGAKTLTYHAVRGNTYYVLALMVPAKAQSVGASEQLITEISSQLTP